MVATSREPAEHQIAVIARVVLALFRLMPLNTALVSYEIEMRAVGGRGVSPDPLCAESYRVDVLLTFQREKLLDVHSPLLFRHGR